MTLSFAAAPAEDANALLDQRRLSLALRSGASLLFAVAFFWPTLTFPMLVKLFAVYAFLDGILTLAPGGWSLAQRAVWPLLAAARAIGCATMREADPGYLLLLNGIAAGFFARALLSPAAGDVVVLSTWIGLYVLTVGILLFKLTLQRYRPIFVDLSM